METLTKLAVIAIAFAVASESRIIRRESTDEGRESTGESMDCYVNKYENCVEPNLAHFDSILSMPASTADFLSNRSKIEELAAAAQTAVECLEEERAKPACEGHEEKDDTDLEVEFVADFLASPANIDILVNLSSSPCLSNPSLIEIVAPQFSQCATVFMSYMQSLGDACIALEGMKDCWANTMASYCGQAAADVIHSAWDFVMESPQDRAGMIQLPVSISTVENCYGQTSAA